MPLAQFIPADVTAALSLLAIVITIFVGGAKVISVVRGSKPVALEQPIEVKAAAHYAAREEVARLEEHNRAEHAELTRRIAEAEAGLRDEIKKDVGGIYDRMNRVAEDVAALKSATNMQDHQMHEIGKKLDNVLTALAVRTTHHDSRPG